VTSRRLELMAGRSRTEAEVRAASPSLNQTPDAAVTKQDVPTGSQARSPELQFNKPASQSIGADNIRD
jgi:hypothetical protein